MSLSLRLCLVASFSNSLIISRHRRSRICWTGDIIPACVVGGYRARGDKRSSACKNNIMKHGMRALFYTVYHEFLDARVEYFEDGSS